MTSSCTRLSSSSSLVSSTATATLQHRGARSPLSTGRCARSACPSEDLEIDDCLDLLRRYDAPVELLEAVSAGRAQREIAAAWLSRCHRLSQALVRNRKAEIQGFTKRKAHRIEVTPTEAEVELERDVRHYIRERFAAAEQGRQTAVGLVLVTFQKMLCSSSKAFAGALESRAARLLNEIDRTSRSETMPIWRMRTCDSWSSIRRRPCRGRHADSSGKASTQLGRRKARGARFAGRDDS